MAGPYRQQGLIEAPIEDVWAVVSDPRTHADWWPDVIDVTAAEDLGEGDEYTRVSKLMPFRDAVEAVWVVERLDALKEAHFRCTLTGSYARFALTPAQSDTFVEVEAGMEPTGLRWKLMRALGGSYSRAGCWTCWRRSRARWRGARADEPGGETAGSRTA